MNKLILKIKIIINSPLPFYRILFLVIGRLILNTVLEFGHLIDNLFFRKYKKIVITKPVFLIGHPRSGTTFLHRFLLDINPKYKGMYLWEMLIPSLFLRFFLKPLVKFIDRTSKKQLYDVKIHTTGLFKAETDDVALFFKSFEGLFFWLYFGAFREYDSTELLENELTQMSNIQKTLANLKTLHSKNIAYNYSNNIIFSKSFSLILDIEQVIESFPSAKIILLIRDPLEVIPSSMSLTRNVLQNLYDFNKLDSQTKLNYYNNLYTASIIFYKSLHKAIKTFSKYDNNILLVAYKNLKSNFINEFGKITNFLNLSLTEEINSIILEQETKQKTYKSKHQYSLEEFGLNEQKIKTDFDFIYRNYEV